MKEKKGKIGSTYPLIEFFEGRMKPSLLSEVQCFLDVSGVAGWGVRVDCDVVSPASRTHQVAKWTFLIKKEIFYVLNKFEIIKSYKIHLNKSDVLNL